MSKRTLTTLLSAIALSATAALSVPIATSVAAPPEAQPAFAHRRNASNKLYIVQLAETPVAAYKGGIGLRGDEAGRRQEDRPEQPRSSTTCRYLTAPRRRARRRRAAARSSTATATCSTASRPS